MGSSRETTVLYHQLLENPTGSMTKDETDKSTISKLSNHFLSSFRLLVYPMIISMTCFTPLFARKEKWIILLWHLHQPQHRTYSMWPKLEIHLSLMRCIEIHLSYSTTWIQGQHVDEYHSVYKEPVFRFWLWETGGHESSFLLQHMAHSLISSPYSSSFLKDLRAAVT